jgi:hypothetical protein
VLKKSPDGVYTSIAEGFLIEERGLKSPLHRELESFFKTLLALLYRGGSPGGLARGSR